MKEIIVDAADTWRHVAGQSRPEDGGVLVPNLLLDPSERGRMMSRIRSKNSAMELVVFREMRKRGVHFQKHYERAPGKPDLARPRDKLAVFIDGDFWHGREIERVVAKHGHDSPWVKKLRRNMERDDRQVARLKSAGWRVLRVWESDLRKKSTRTAALDEIEQFLRGGPASTAPG
jgi:DNA mismatch endonuclease (patch repair protein)